MKLLRASVPLACVLLSALVSGSVLFADASVALDSRPPVENAHLVLRAFMVSYPDRVSGVDYDAEAGDWYMTVDGKRFYWASGRLLPPAERGDYAKWRAYVDYLYPRSVPDPAGFPPELLSRLSPRALAERRKSSPGYNVAFYDALYDGRTRRRIEAHIRRFDYLGKRVSVHESVVAPLKRVEAKIRALADRDAEVALFLESVSSIEGYNWREISDRPTRSNHSWGIAVDILPRNWGKKNIYWNWVSYWNDRWMMIPPERRWSPPDVVIAAFEEEGFVWGGKWLLWDTMHFEYRPELLVLQRWGHAGEDFR